MEKEMWETYVKQAGGVTFDGKPLPTWDELGEERQACWKAAASVCANEIKWLRWALRKIRGALGDPISNLLPHEIAQDALDRKW